MQSLSLVQNGEIRRSLLRERLEDLRARNPALKTGATLSQKARLPFSAVPQGLPKGALIELSGNSGSGKTELALRFLAENPKIRAAWIEEKLSAYPCAFPQMGVELERVLFVEAGGEILWAALQSLRSSLFPAIILTRRDPFTEIELRRLQLAAEKSLSTVFILSPRTTARGNWALAFQLEVRRALKHDADPKPLVTIRKGAFQDGASFVR